MHKSNSFMTKKTMLVNLMELMAARDLVAKALNKIDEMLKNGGMVS